MDSNWPDGDTEWRPSAARRGQYQHNDEKPYIWTVTRKDGEGHISPVTTDRRRVASCGNSDDRRSEYTYVHVTNNMSYKRDSHYSSTSEYKSDQPEYDQRRFVFNSDVNKTCTANNNETDERIISRKHERIANAGRGRGQITSPSLRTTSHTRSHKPRDDLLVSNRESGSSDSGNSDFPHVAKKVRTPPVSGAFANSKSMLNQLVKKQVRQNSVVDYATKPLFASYSDKQVKSQDIMPSSAVGKVKRPSVLKPQDAPYRPYCSTPNDTSRHALDTPRKRKRIGNKACIEDQIDPMEPSDVELFESDKHLFYVDASCDTDISTNESVKESTLNYRDSVVDKRLIFVGDRDENSSTVPRTRRLSALDQLTESYCPTDSESSNDFDDDVATLSQDFSSQECFSSTILDKLISESPSTFVAHSNISISSITPSRPLANMKITTPSSSAHAESNACMSSKDDIIPPVCRSATRGNNSTAFSKMYDPMKSASNHKWKPLFATESTSPTPSYQSQPRQTSDSLNKNWLYENKSPRYEYKPPKKPPLLPLPSSVVDDQRKNISQAKGKLPLQPYQLTRKPPPLLKSLDKHEKNISQKKDMNQAYKASSNPPSLLSLPLPAAEPEQSISQAKSLYQPYQPSQRPPPLLPLPSKSHHEVYERSDQNASKWCVSHKTSNKESFPKKSGRKWLYADAASSESDDDSSSDLSECKQSDTGTSYTSSDTSPPRRKRSSIDKYESLRHKRSSNYDVPPRFKKKHFRKERSESRRKTSRCDGDADADDLLIEQRKHCRRSSVDSSDKSPKERKVKSVVVERSTHRSKWDSPFQRYNQPMQIDTKNMYSPLRSRQDYNPSYQAKNAPSPSLTRYKSYRPFNSSDFGEAPFLDTHCHIDYLFHRISFRGTFAKYISENPFPANYDGCVAIFCDPDAFYKEMWKDLLKEDRIWGAFGIHPHASDEYSYEIEERIKKALKHPKAVALGEIGLDYSDHCKCDKKIQHMIFKRQLEIAIALDKPVVIHSRQAEKDTQEIIESIVPTDYKIHRHCFTGTAEEANHMLSRYPNSFIGLTNLVSYWTAKQVHNTAAEIPLDRILLETDAPFFVPQQVKKNDRSVRWANPGMAVYVAQRIAELKGLRLNDVLRQTRKNAKKMYGV